MRKLICCFLLFFLSPAFPLPVRVMIARGWRTISISSNQPYRFKELNNQGLSCPPMQDVTITFITRVKKLYCLKLSCSNEDIARKAERDVQYLGYSAERSGKEVIVKCELEVSRKALQERLSDVEITSSTYEEELKDARFEVKSAEERKILPPTIRLRFESEAKESKGPPLFSVSIDGRKPRKYRGMLEVFANNFSVPLLVNEIELEDYLKGVLPAEIPASFSPETLKAQAVIARTYALHCLGRHRKEGYDFCDSQHCQVYLGFDYEKDELNQAIEVTKGIIVDYNGHPALTPFHSTCGGITEDASVWGLELPYLKPKVDGSYSFIPKSEADLEKFLQTSQSFNCQSAPDFRWSREYTSDELLKIFSLSLPIILRNDCKLSKIKDIRVVERTTSGRAKVIEIETEDETFRLKGDDIRWAFGNGRIASQGSLPSLLFYIERKCDIFKIVGGGSGHGIGFCQWGAEGLARKGWDYVSIIKFYFPGTTLRKLEH